MYERLIESLASAGVNLRQTNSLLFPAHVLWFLELKYEVSVRSEPACDLEIKSSILKKKADALLTLTIHPTMYIYTV